MWTKLRPGLRAFLQRAAQRFELHICTMGDRDYAQQIAALLDPTRRLFAERIVSSVCDTGCECQTASVATPFHHSCSISSQPGAAEKCAAAVCCCAAVLRH